MPLVALDQLWAVAMPKKTGSQSLVGMCEAAKVAKVVGPYHGCDWDGIGRRYLVVRDPRERLASMYWWSRTHCPSFLAGSGGPAEWLARFLTAWKSPNWKADHHEWLTPQSVFVERFRPDKVFKLEDGLRAALDAISVTVEGIRHANPTKGKRTDRKPFGETFDPNSPGLSDWLDADAGGWY